MSKALQWKITFILVALVASIWSLYPTYRWYSMPQERQEEMREKQDPILDRVLNLGLDLQGGMHLTLEARIDQAPDDISPREAVDRALEIIRNRVDQFGVAEPHIVRRGERWIDVQLPGVAETERAIELVGRTARLEFHLVSEESPPMEDEEVPEGYMVLEGRDGSRYMVGEEPDLTGASLRDAGVSTGGDFGQPHVTFRLDSEGGRTFERLTEANIDRQLAIVLDDVVQSAPVIRSRIPGGSGIIEGGFTLQDARDLAMLLRAGALPVPVDIIENRTIGPALGAQSIRAGVTALIAGFILVLVFMFIYYKSSGLIANLALLLNILILLGVMALPGLAFTLTLPGIAGIVLITGMAVDANVLIFERIREELLSGKTSRVAVDAGYKKATSTILDANITTLVAAAFLFQFGTGPIQGFAVTLFIGISASMFTALVVTKTVFDIISKGKNIKELKI
ncbi:MAG: protein translocase subunit SecD [Elusimicrobiota bacterium]